MLTGCSPALLCAAGRWTLPRSLYRARQGKDSAPHQDPAGAMIILGKAPPPNKYARRGNVGARTNLLFRAAQKSVVGQQSLDRRTLPARRYAPTKLSRALFCLTALCSFCTISLSRKGWDEEHNRLGGCSYSPKGGMDDAHNLSCAEVLGDYHHQGNPYEGSQR